ncbi:tRNA lysidine(34) synthetase TilS [Psychrobacter sp. 1U2]|uniref:tRNA lysidine(34) synthetase TilS n=1 Tax=Psychrobacter sp. 1U2 TaxID=3453577 RepID=UPI003F446F1A
MTNSAIKSYPIKPIAELAVDQQLAAAVLSSLADYHQQLLGRRIWLACSGGRDSLVLAALCLQLYEQGRLPFLPQLLHVDHGLQANSSFWANHVAKWAAAQQLPCTILKAEVQGRDEQAARQARYRVMQEYINQGDVLMLAHHADDQAETVLMRLIQGAGIKGLAAMQPWREQAQQGRHHILWRPWLTITRAAISDYARRLQLPYIDDPTNISGDNVRSGLRREVMPLLANYNPNVIGNIARSAQLLSEAQAIVEAQAEQDLQMTAVEVLKFSTAQQVLAIDKLQLLSTARQKQLLHYWLAQDEPLPPAKQLVDDVYALTQRQDNNHQTELDWYAHLQHYRIYRYRQQLYRLSHDFLNWLALNTLEKSYCLSKSLAIDIRKSMDTGYLWQLKIDWDKLDNDQYQELIDNKISLKITPLGRQQKIQTMTMGQAQAGKKLYQTLAIPVWLRDSLVVVSAVITDTEIVNNDEHAKTAVPLLLLSPFHSWTLKSDLSHRDIAEKLTVLSKACVNVLQEASKL